MIIGGWRGPGWRIVDADPGQARQVRDWIRAAITRHDCPVDPADAALAVSELYANAVMHGPAGGRVLAGYCLWSAGARIVVCDGGGPTTPRVRQGADLAECGRGLARWPARSSSGQIGEIRPGIPEREGVERGGLPIQGDPGVDEGQADVDICSAVTDRPRPVSPCRDQQTRRRHDQQHPDSQG